MKLVVITGVTQGLGRAMIDKFNEAGWTIAGCGRSQKSIEELNKIYGGKHFFKKVDIVDEKSVEEWAKEVAAQFGSAVLLINNASIINKNATLWEISSIEFNSVMDINVNGTANVLRAFLPEMIEKKRGIIVNMSSSWGRQADAMVAPYCASKFAIEGLTQSLALELPAGMAAIALDPGGGINTPMLQISGPDYAHLVPTAEEWAEEAVPFILGLSPGDNGKSLTCPLVK